MPGKKKRLTTRISAASSDLAPIPDCEGPKLQAYAGRTDQIEWLERLDEYRDDSSSNSAGSEGYVFKVRIDSKLYALKVFKYFNIKATRYYWSRVLASDYDVQKITYHTDPFFAECRAYGRINEWRKRRKVKYDIAILCHGYIYLDEKYRKILEDLGAVLDEESLAVQPQTPLPPIRAILKELASDDSGINEDTAYSVLRSIKKLNSLGIYNRDVRADNFRDGLLVDFGRSRTRPHCYLEDRPRELTITKAEVLDGFDTMMSDNSIRTHVRGARNLEYAQKLRQRDRVSYRV